MGIGLLMFLLVDSLFLWKQLNQHLFFGHFVPKLTNVISNFKVICMLIKKPLQTNKKEEEILVERRREKANERKKK